MGTAEPQHIRLYCGISFRDKCLMQYQVNYSPFSPWAACFMRGQRASLRRP